MPDIPILTTSRQIETLADELMHEPAVAIDFEMDSMHNYREKVCLAQVSTVETTLIADPVAGADLSPLEKVFAAPGIRKIFHAADYDLRSLKRDYGITVRNLFDTMISAQFCGEEKIGLADLLQKYFGVELDKKYQRADWSQRPLKPEMVRYAAEDTRHLHRLAAILEERLRELGRLAWVREECERLEDISFTNNDGPLFLRFKGAGKLERRQLAMLEELLQWREQEAERRNCPPFKVLGNKPILSLVLTEPSSRQELQAIDGINDRLARRYGEKLIACLEKARELPAEEWPHYPRQARNKRDPEVEKVLDDLKKWRREKADALKLDPGVLINNAQLETIARIRPQGRKELAALENMRQWQVDEFGNELLERLG